MDMGDGSSFIDEINHSDLFGHEGDGAAGFDWADDIISSLEGEDRTPRNTLLESTVINSSHRAGSSNVQYGGQSSISAQFSQTGTVNVPLVQNSSATTLQAPVQNIQQPTQLLPNLANLTQGGGQLIQGLNGQIFLKPLPNGQFQLATQPQIQQIQHPQQSSSPIPIQPHPSPQVNQSPIPISSPHVGSTSSSPHVSRSLTPLQQSRQYSSGIPQNVNMVQVQGTGSQSQPQMIRNMPINTQISNISNFQTQVLQSHGHNQVPNQGQNFVNTQNTVIQNPNVVNVNVAHVLCSNPQFQGQQQGQSIQGTLIQTADGKHIIIPSSQLPSSNQIQIQNLPQMAIQPQINVVPTSSSTGTTPLVQGGQVVENNAAALGGLGYIRIATPSTSSQQEPKVQQQTPATHFLGLNSQGQQIIIQRTPTPGQNIVLRQVTPSNLLQIPQQQTPQASQILPQTSQATQQILLPQVQRIVTGQQGQQQVKLVAPANMQTGNLPMTINIGGQNVILPGNIQQLLQQPHGNQVQKTSTSENIAQNRLSSSGILVTTASGILTTPSSSSSRVVTTSSVTQQPGITSSVINNLQSNSNLGCQGQNLNSQVPTFLLSTVNASTANMTPVTTTVSQTKQVISQVNISNSPKMYQTISSVTSNVSSTVSAQQKSFLSAVTNAPKLPTATIQLTPQAQQQIRSIQSEIRKLQSLKDPTDHQKQQLVQLQEYQKQIIAKGQIKLQPQSQQSTSIHTASNATTSFIGQPALSLPQQGQVGVKPQSSSPLVTPGNVQSQITGGLPAQGLVTSDTSLTSTCPTKSVQSQHGSIMSISPTGNKSIQQPIIVNQAQSNSTNFQPQSGSVVIQGQQGQVLVQGQQGQVLVQGQQGSVMVQDQQSSMVVQGQQSPVVVQSQQGSMIVQGQSGSMKMGVQTSASPSPSGSGIGTVTMATPTKGLPQGLQGKVLMGANQQVAVPTQIKIGNHILTLNLTPDQKDKVQGYLSKMPPEQQQQQMALFLKLQHQQKLHAQVQAQMQQQKKLQAQSNQQVSNIQSQLPLMVQQQSQSVPSSTSSGIISIEHPSTSPSKPNIVQRVSVAAIPKHQLIHQQLGKDQANALHTDTETPFKNQRDTNRRLLRYHVFQTKNPPDDLVKKDDEMFDDLSEGLVRKKDWMFEKYRGLLLEESMREQQTAEIMMIQKMMNEDLKETLEEEKRTVKRNPECFEVMPRKYLKVEPQYDDSQDSKFDPSAIQVKIEKDKDPPPSLIKKESYDSDSSRPSTPKFKLVIKSDGQGYSSSITEEEMNQNGTADLHGNDNVDSMDFISSIHVKEEQIEVDDNLEEEEEVRLDDTLKPFESYSDNKMDESYNHNSLNNSDDLTGADSNSDVTVVSDNENRNISDAIVIDDDDDDDDENDEENDDLGLHDRIESNSPKKTIEPVMKHEDISTDFTDYFAKQYQTSSSASSFFPARSHDLPSDNVISSFPSSGQISNDNVSYSQNSDAHSTQTIPYSDDGNSGKEEDLSNDVDYNKSTSSFAQYEPISSPEADQEEPSFSNYLSYKSAFNISGIRDQSLNYDLSSNSNRDTLMNNHQIDATENLWQDELTEEDETENADKIKAEMESAINSILSLN